MSEHFSAGSWSVQKPASWSTELREDCVAFHDPDDLASIQISSFAKGAPVTQDDLLDFASSYLEAGAEKDEVELGHYRGLALSFGDGRFFCRQWYLRSGEQLVFVTYTVDREKRATDEPALEAMLQSLRPVDRE